MKHLMMICAAIAIALPMSAKDTDEPFLDPSETNPAESLRRVARLMRRLSVEDMKSDQMKEIHNTVMDRLTRTLVRLSAQQQQISSDGGKGTMRQKQKRQQQMKVKDRKSENNKNKESKDVGDDKSKPKLEGQGGNQRPPEALDNDVSEFKDDLNKWGKLPGKTRDALELNLARDVPDDLENDMKDFLDRVRELN